MVYPITAYGNQPEQPGIGTGPNFGSLATLGAGGSAVFASGFISTKGGGRLWDKYISGLRAVETGSPGAVLRTFRLSEFLSPLESWGKISTPASVMKGGLYGDFLRKTIGDVSGDITMTRTGSIFGEITDETGKILGYGMQIKAGTQQGTAIADYYARIKGLQLSEHQSLNEALLRDEWRKSKTPASFNDWINSLEPELRQKRLILSAKRRSKLTIMGKDFNLSQRMAKTVAKGEVLTNLFRAKAASTAGRLNTLLTAPFDLPGIKEVAKRVPFLRTMAVKPGSNLQILGRLTRKGVIAGLAWKGIEYADYLRSEGSPVAPVAAAAIGAGIGNILGRRPGMMFSKTGLIAGAALGLVAGVAPRFDEGLLHGVATIGTDVTMAQARISEQVGLTESLQQQERVTPALTSPATGLAFGGVGALLTGLYSYGGLLHKSAVSRKTGETFASAVQRGRDVAREAGAGSFWKGSIGRKLSKVPILGAATKIKSPTALGFLGGLAAWQGVASLSAIASGNLLAAIPGAGLFGTQETPEELQRIYSGEEEIPVRKGRWWEFGRSSKYEGGKIDYYRPHFIHRLKTRAYQKGLYGDEEEYWAHNPVLNPLKAIFGSDDWKYWYEQKYQMERPGTVTSTYGEDVPFIGPLIAATVGKLLKPRKLVRPEEWITPEGEFVHRPDIRGETEPAYHLGGLEPGAPVAPEEATQLLNELNYRRREAVGLIGFVEGALTKEAIGREELFQNLQTFAPMGRESSSEYWLWKHLNLGGAAGLSEPVRRFIPRTRSYLETYNPLQNAMPSWIPDDYFLDLKYGNPFSKIAEAEVRLPGPGYASLYPELEGLSPEQYPLAHRVKILGDIAMYSNEYKKSLAYAKSNIRSMSQKEARIILQTEEQVRTRKKKREFQEYRFDSSQLTEQEVTIRDVISPRRFLTEEYGDLIMEAPGVGPITNSQAAMEFSRNFLVGKRVSVMTPTMESRRFSRVADGIRMKALPVIGGENWGDILAQEGLAGQRSLEDEFEQREFSAIERLIGRGSEALMHSIETPVEYLTPFSPTSKLIRQRSSIEEYVASEAIGTSNAFWDRPIENFLAPAYEMTKYRAGIVDIPENIQERRNLQEYYDMLQWVKSSRLESVARQRGELSEAAEFKRQKESTVFGMDVFKSPTNIMRGLPRRERDFFGAFSAARSEEDRARILELIPENEQRIYLSQWLRQEEGVAYAKRQAKLETEEDDKVIALTSMLRKSEGFGYTGNEQERWLQETGGRIEFDEYIREQRAEEYFGTHSLPGADWLGWSPAVQLKDIQMVHAEMAGIDYHDLDLWDQRKRSLARKPYIDQSLIEEEFANSTEYEDSWKVAKNSRTLAKMYDDHFAEVQTLQMGANTGSDKYNITVIDNRKELIEQAYRKMGM